MPGLAITGAEGWSLRFNGGRIPDRCAAAEENESIQMDKMDLSSALTRNFTRLWSMNTATVELLKVFAKLFGNVNERPTL